MTEPEVSLYIALYYIKNNLTNEDIHVSIDGAHIKTGNTIHFDIFKFLKYHNCKKVDSDQNRWQGKYCVGDHKTHIVISSVPGIGDINIVMPNGKTILIESKKGKNNKKGQEYPLMREAIGQLMTGGELSENIVPVVAVPYSEKSYELAKRWVGLPQMMQIGIKFMLVYEDGEVCYIKS